MPVFKLLRFYDERLRDIGMGFPRRRWILYYIISMLAPVGLAVSGWIRSTPAITVAGVVVGVGIWAWFYSQAQTARRLRFEQEAFLNSGHVAACIQEEQARILQDWLHKERWLSVAAVAHLSSGVDQELAEHRRRHLAGWKHVPLFLGIFLAGLSGAITRACPRRSFRERLRKLADCSRRSRACHVSL